MTLEEACNRFIRMSKQYHKPSTQRMHAYHIGLIYQAFGHRQHIDDVSGGVMVEWFRANRPTVSNSTINGTLRTLRALLRFNECGAPVKMLRQERHRPRVLTRIERHELLQACITPAETLAVALGLYAGLRVGEIQHLRVGDVSLAENMIHVVPKEWRGPDGILCRWSPKNYQSRSIPFAPGQELGKAVAAHWPLDSESSEKWMFRAYDGSKNPISQQVVERWIQAAFERAGLRDPNQSNTTPFGERVGFHILRRSWATHLVEAGVDLNTVRELGGWSSLLVMQSYLAASDEAKERAILSLGEPTVS